MLSASSSWWWWKEGTRQKTSRTSRDGWENFTVWPRRRRRLPALPVIRHQKNKTNWKYVCTCLCVRQQSCFFLLFPQPGHLSSLTAFFSFWLTAKPKLTGIGSKSINLHIFKRNPIFFLHIATPRLLPESSRLLANESLSVGTKQTVRDRASRKTPHKGGGGKKKRANPADNNALNIAGESQLPRSIVQFR